MPFKFTSRLRKLTVTMETPSLISRKNKIPQREAPVEQ
jgi:hypothetical protein